MCSIKIFKLYITVTMAVILVSLTRSTLAQVPFTERVISTTASGAHSVFAMDLDGDGNIDVLSASVLDNKFAWYENDGGSTPSFIEHVISTSADAARSVFAIDVDDGVNDLQQLTPDHKLTTSLYTARAASAVPPKNVIRVKILF